VDQTSTRARQTGRVSAIAGQTRTYAFTREFLAFGFKQAWACLFGGAMLALLLITDFAWPANAPIARYDFLVIAALSIQVALLAFRLERPEEAVVILVFHIVGTAMELFKTAQGSWIYPEPSLLRLGGVPLFSGFMYAAVGSYIARIWRIFDIRFSHYPPIWTTWVLGVGAYVNFFTHHFGPDVRAGLFALTAVLFWRTKFHFRPADGYRSMPFLVGASLFSSFIWIAENVATFANAWIYPSQEDAWTPVSPMKIGAWFLLMLLSFVLVSAVNRPRPLEPIWAGSRTRGSDPAAPGRS
jgi:uncharacterized membrane protein YoaT (DUF817 family)